MVYSRNAHFINPPMFTFCSDLPSVMPKLRKDCLASNEFVFAYGCAPHAIHNLCMDLYSFPGVKLVLKQILYMVKTLRSSHLLLQLFDKLCDKKYKKEDVYSNPFHEDQMGDCVLCCPASNESQDGMRLFAWGDR